MAAPARLQAALAVALLGRNDSARASLRRALEELGANVVFEGDPAAAQPEQVLQAAPSVVLVNLATGVEDDIDHLDALFDSPQVNVVFNEADVSSQLEGWDQARWARHLAAKITGRDATIPPPPPGAEPLPDRSFMPVPGAPPTPAQLTAERPIEEFMIEAEERVEDLPSDHLPYLSGKRASVVEEPEPDFRLDRNEIEGALSQIGGPPPAVEERAVPEPEVPEIIVHEGEAAEFDAGLDLAALDAALELERSPAAAPSSGKSDAALLDEALSGFNLDLGGDNDTGIESDADSLGFEDGSVAVASVSLSDDGMGLEVGDDSGVFDDDIAALAAQMDALQDSTARGEVQELSFETEAEAEPESEDAPVIPVAAAAAPARVPAAAPGVAAPAPKKPSFGPLDLSPMDEEVPAATAAPAASSKPGYDFGSLGGLSLEAMDDEAAAPAAVTPAAPAAKAEPKYDFGSLNLSLEPVDGEEAPAAAAAPTPAPAASDDLGLPSVDALFAAMELAPVSTPTATAKPTSTKPIPRVIVLGASIGGPDAVRTFVAGIPENFPALFLLVQHLENGFFERLAQQLQKSSKLPVRVPDPGRPARAGEVLVIPAQQRVQIQPDGSIALKDHAAPPKYTPSIDLVLRDIGDQFGRDATAIIFSGMAGDAIEGAVYLTSVGGEVWAQDPASCVVSSMVDGARARGVVEFLGSPRELAERCVEKYGN